MPKTCELTPFERGEIVGLSKGGHSVRNISEILGKPKSTVQDVITKYNEENRTLCCSWRRMESTWTWKPERLLKLVESMPRRIKAVIKSRGYPIPY